MNDMNELIEASLRDVFEHQAATVDAPNEQPTLPLASMTELPPRRGTRVRAFAGTAAFLATAAAVVLFVASSTGTQTTHDTAPRPRPHNNDSRVLAALTATKASGGFVSTYDITGTLGPQSTTPTSRCVVPTSRGRGGPMITGPLGTVHLPNHPICFTPHPAPPAEIKGDASVVIDPFGIESHSTISGVISAVTVDADAANVTMTASGSASQKSSLSAFAETVSASVGDREGSVVMLALSSPTGYLAVSRDAAAGAQPVGSGTVDGVHVDYFEVTLTPAQMAAVPGTSREQAKTIANALHVLAAEGYTGTTMRIAIGDDGLIHALRSTANFEDGAKVTLATTFSQFGCVRQATPAHAACVLAK